MVTSYLRSAAAASMLSTSKLVDMPQLQTINTRIIAPLPSFQIVCLCCMDIVLTHYKHIREWPGLFMYIAITMPICVLHTSTLWLFWPSYNGFNSGVERGELFISVCLCHLYSVSLVSFLVSVFLVVNGGWRAFLRGCSRWGLCAVT